MPGVHWSNLDRKSTRLNSSHTIISYAVFCLKKTKHSTGTTRAPPPRHPADSARRRGRVVHGRSRGQARAQGGGEAAIGGGLVCFFLRGRRPRDPRSFPRPVAPEC